MEAYENPEMLKAPSDFYWSDSSLTAWINSAQYTVRSIMRELQIKDHDEAAYNLGKNLWHAGYDEDDIRDQLTKYAASK